MKSHELLKAKSLAERGEFGEALRVCAELLAGQHGDSVEILRTRAHVYALMGDYELALVDRKSIIDQQSCALSDIYLAADCAMKAQRFDDAIRWFKSCISLGEREGDAWFRSASLFYLAFCEMTTGRLDDALESIDLASSQEPRIELPVPGRGMCSDSSLKGEIRRRISLSSGSR